MRLSKCGWVTYKEVPKDAEVVSHQLQLRAGLIHKVGGGLYNYMPFAVRVLRKIENIIREEMDKIGCQEITMSMVTPSELWKETGRWDVMGPNMAKLKDRNNKELCLSPTNEEACCDVFRSFIQSYKQLPITYYQINTKFRDEIRPRFGLMRGREFIMKDAYSFHVDQKCLNDFYQKMFNAYSACFKRMGLSFIAVEADGGVIATGDSKTHEFQVIAENGEDKIIYDSKTGWGANIEKALTKKVITSFNDTSLGLEKVSTPLKQLTMDEVAEQMKLHLQQCIKSVCYKVIKNKNVEFVIAFVLGDDEVNEVKFKNFLSVEEIIPASEEEIKKLGLVRGYIGPIGLPKNIKAFFDLTVSNNHSYAIGANQDGFHYKNFKISKDLNDKISKIDIRLSCAGDLSLSGNPIELKKGIEVGHIFQLGDKYTKAMGISVLDQNGKQFTPTMGTYGIGVSRLMSAAIEQHFDESGIKWPINIAPFQIYFSRITKTEAAKKISDEIYNDLVNNGFEVLYDDRDLSPGVAFKDADLLGIPIRVVFGERDYEQNNNLEIKIRSTGIAEKVHRDNLKCILKEKIENLTTASL